MKNKITQTEPFKLQYKGNRFIIGDLKLNENDLKLFMRLLGFHRFGHYTKDDKSLFSRSAFLIDEIKTKWPDHIKWTILHFKNLSEVNKGYLWMLSTGTEFRVSLNQ